MRSFVVRPVVVLVACLLLSVLVVARPVRNSFINHRIRSISGLLNQVANDSAVADRYMRHFGMSRTELRNYLSSLHREGLRHPGTFTVYSIPPDGHVKMHLEHLNTGEPVFADAAGNPVLLVKCGNPLTLGPSKALIPNNVEASGPQGGGDTLRADNAPSTGPDFGAAELALATPSAPDFEIASTPPVTSAFVETPDTGRAGVFTAGTGPNLGSLGFLPILGGLIWGVGNHGHTFTPPAVPEPSSVIPMVLGVGLIGLRGFKRPRSK